MMLTPLKHLWFTNVKCLKFIEAYLPNFANLRFLKYTFTYNFL